jgi:Hsp20/alpha crystallin family
MALIRFRPFSQELSSDLTDIHAQVNRLFDGFLGQPNGSGKIERQWTGDAEEASHHRRERWFGKFERAFSLPAPVDAGQVKATYRDGVLTVNLPKAEENKPKEIKIEAA